VEHPCAGLGLEISNRSGVLVGQLSECTSGGTAEVLRFQFAERPRPTISLQTRNTYSPKVIAHANFLRARQDNTVDTDRDRFPMSDQNSSIHLSNTIDCVFLN